VQRTAQTATRLLLTLAPCAQLTVKRYALDLKSLLLVPQLRAAFRRHLVREYSAENLEVHAVMR
jgi:hypothetical protein